MNQLSRIFQHLRFLGMKYHGFRQRTFCCLNVFTNVNEIHNIVLPESYLVHSICAKPTALTATVWITIEVA